MNSSCLSYSFLQCLFFIWKSSMLPSNCSIDGCFLVVWIFRPDSLLLTKSHNSHSKLTFSVGCFVKGTVAIKRFLFTSLLEIASSAVTYHNKVWYFQNFKLPFPYFIKKPIHTSGSQNRRQLGPTLCIQQIRSTNF